jgi:hypothetical protein
MVEGLAKLNAPSPEDVRRMLAEIRQRCPLPRAAIAAHLGIPAGTLRRWEDGTRVPTLASRRLIEIHHRTMTGGAGAGIQAATQETSEPAEKSCPTVVVDRRVVLDRVIDFAGRAVADEARLPRERLTASRLALQASRSLNDLDRIEHQRQQAEASAKVSRPRVLPPLLGQAARPATPHGQA